MADDVINIFLSIPHIGTQNLKKYMRCYNNIVIIIVDC